MTTTSDIQVLSIQTDQSCSHPHLSWDAQQLSCTRVMAPSGGCYRELTLSQFNISGIFRSIMDCDWNNKLDRDFVSSSVTA